MKSRRGSPTAASLFLEGSSKNKTAAISDGRFFYSLLDRNLTAGAANSKAFPAAEPAFSGYFS
ncbi:MAG: hypothetical protein KIT48_10895 [Pseudolabrys sp.]|nr:hypothetical protein [Pseudolabrys sp.]